MILLLCLIVQTISKRYEMEAKFRYSGSLSGLSGYNELFLTIDAGEALMMVEWDDAVLTMNIPDAQMENVKFSKHLGYSLFTFKNKATILMNFKKPISFFYFYSPIHAAGSATQYISNFKNSELTVTNVGQDVYVQTLGPYTLDTSLIKSGNSFELIYSGDKKTTSISNVHIPDLISISCFHNQGITGKITGTISMQSQKNFNPTVPSTIILNYKKVSTGQNNFNTNGAYGGVEKEGTYKEASISQVYSKHYILISNDINKDFNTLYIRDDDGNYKPIRKGEKYEESQDSSFQRELFLQTEYCYSYVYLDTIKSSKLSLNNDGTIKYKSINQWNVPEYCQKYVRIGVFNMVIIIFVVVLVVVIVVFVVVIVCIKKKARKQQANDQSTADRSLL